MRSSLLVLAAGWLLAACAALAAHPLVTEDAGTQSAGNAELENGFSWTRDGDDRSFAFQPQLSWGLLPALDLIVAPSWLRHRTAEVVRRFDATVGRVGHEPSDFPDDFRPLDRAGCERSCLVR